MQGDQGAVVEGDGQPALDLGCGCWPWPCRYSCTCSGGAPLAVESFATSAAAESAGAGSLAAHHGTTISYDRSKSWTLKAVVTDFQYVRSGNTYTGIWRLSASPVADQLTFTLGPNVKDLAGNAIRIFNL